MTSKPAVFAALVVGAVLGGMAVEYWFVTHGVAPAGAQPAVTGAAASDFGSTPTGWSRH